MKKILTIIGARPQIIKAAALSRAFESNFKGKIREYILHTGQHYDENMSEVFFTELGIPAPSFRLECGNASQGVQTAKMLEGIEKVIGDLQPDAVVVYGDTNSTLAGSIAASKMLIPVIHIEAGLRSFNKSMPEEINRIVCDHVSSLLFSPTKAGIENLEKEGFDLHVQPPYSNDRPKVFHCGDVMFDNSLYFSQLSKEKENVFRGLGLSGNDFVLVTVHRQANTDEPERLNAVFRSILEIADRHQVDIILPLHPRTRGKMEKDLESELYNALSFAKRIHIIPPVSFLEMIALEKNAKLVMTDSGGVQKEAFFFQKPCIILRNETEWVELVNMGAAELADVNPDKVLGSYSSLIDKNIASLPNPFGDGKAAEFIAGEIHDFIYSA